MPNWCSNDLFVKGNGALEFLEACKGKTPSYFIPENQREFYQDEVTKDGYQIEREEYFTFNALVPVPQDILNKGYSGDSTFNMVLGREKPNDGYTWQIQNWGTKWDVRDLDVYIQEVDQVGIIFSTAWSPPIAWIQKVSALYPHLSFTIRYEELGDQIAGKIVFKAGKAVESYQPSTYEEFKEFCIDEMGYDEDFFLEMEEE